MPSVTVAVEPKPYGILIEPGLLSALGAQLSDFAGRKALLVADGHTGPLYGEAARKALTAGGIDARLCSVPAGEASKSLAQLEVLYEVFLDHGLTRSDLVVALGGGVVGDLTGYAAASFLRGVPLVQVPTTLLAMVDSSVGGKVAVNLPRGKNLVGAFYQPRAVVIDPDTLGTLPQRELGAGLCEVIKYGAILDADLFALLEEAGGWAGLAPRYAEVIQRCCRLKAEVVAQDPEDLGYRMILNFGHTLGHAIEQDSGYGVLHGEAVGIGMVAAARWGEGLGVTEAGTADRIEGLLARYGLPTRYAGQSEAVLQAMKLDKKASGSGVTVVLLERIGACVLRPVPGPELTGLVEASDAQ